MEDITSNHKRAEFLDQFKKCKNINCHIPKNVNSHKVTLVLLFNSKNKKFSSACGWYCGPIIIHPKRDSQIISKCQRIYCGLVL